MTARQALAAGLSLGETYRQLPLAKRNRIPDMPLVISGMGIVTGTTSPPVARLVDMNVMQVLVSVAETGKGRGKLFTHQGLLMTHKAECIVVRIIACIEERWEIFPQNPEIIGTMGIVTTGTIFLRNWPVMVGILGQKVLHIREAAARCLWILAIMASKAKVHRCID